MDWQEKLNEQLNQWRAELDNLAVRARLLEMEARDEFDERLSQLQQRWNTVESDFARYEDGMETRWQTFQTQFEADLERLTRQMSIMRPVP